MRKVNVYFDDHFAGILTENDASPKYTFEYGGQYRGPRISLTMPCQQSTFEFSEFPPFFDGLLPEGVHLEALLKRAKLDRKDYLGQLVAVGRDLVGAVTVRIS